jgi:hypothetical protein
MRRAIAATCLAICAVPAAAQEGPELEFAFEATVTLGQSFAPGDTGRGGRLVIPITGGTFEGPGIGDGIKGRVIPGGWDWQLRRSDGCTEIEADYFLETEDGAIINVFNKGVLCPPGEGRPPAPVRTQPAFEPPLGKYEWLGQAAFIGTLEMAPPEAGPAVRLRFYRAR